MTTTNTADAATASPQPVFSQLDTDTVAMHVPGWLELYNTCFTQPLWNEPHHDLEAYRVHTDPHLAMPGLDAWEARTPEGDLLGVTYGWPTRTWPDTQFYRSLRRGLGDRASDWLIEAAAFAVAELMVYPTAQGSGIGRRLLTALCRPRSTAWLVTPRQAPSAAFYQHLGWTRYGAFTTDADLAMEVYLQHRTCAPGSP